MRECYEAFVIYSFYAYLMVSTDPSVKSGSRVLTARLMGLDISGSLTQCTYLMMSLSEAAVESSQHEQWGFVMLGSLTQCTYLMVTTRPLHQN